MNKERQDSGPVFSYKKKLDLRSARNLELYYLIYPLNLFLMKNTAFAVLLGALFVPALALAGGSYAPAPAPTPAPAANVNSGHAGNTCSGEFSVSTLKSSKPAGVSTVEMRHISDLSRTEQQQLAATRGSASLEAEFHRGSDDCWYILLKTMSSGKTRTVAATPTYTTPTTTTTTDRRTTYNGSDYYTYYTYLRNLENSNTSNSNAGTMVVTNTSTVFRTRDDINFSLYDVITLTAAPSDAQRTLVYANMTESQRASLMAFYGADAEGATIYRRSNGMWYILFN